MKTIEAQVHRLVTNQPTGIVKMSDGLQYSITKKVRSNNEGYHLYITTDEEIKEGDYKYNEKLNCVTQHNREGKGFSNDMKIAANWCKKIVATTDTLLIEKKCNCFATSYEGCSECLESLPGIPDSFIEEYCKTGGIDKVMVEYQSVEYAKPMPMIHQKYYVDELKLDSGNNIIIQTIENKTYTEKDVEIAFCLGFLNRENITVNEMAVQSKLLKEKLKLCKEFIESRK